MKTVRYKHKDIPDLWLERTEYNIFEILLNKLRRHKMKTTIKKLRNITIALIISTAAIWLAWDVFVVANDGSGKATESVVIYDYAPYMPILPFLMVGLTIHWFNREERWKIDYGVVISAAVVVLAFSCFNLRWLIKIHWMIPGIIGGALCYRFFQIGGSE